jgi:hypothetical protein
MGISQERARENQRGPTQWFARFPHSRTPTTRYPEPHKATKPAQSSAKHDALLHSIRFNSGSASAPGQSVGYGAGVDSQHAHVDTVGCGAQLVDEYAGADAVAVRVSSRRPGVHGDDDAARCPIESVGV